MARSVPALRPFGRPEDLDLELDGDGAEKAVTELLTRCSAGLTPGSWRDETVGGRIAALLELVSMSEEMPAFTVPLQCDRPGCSALLEVALRPDAMPEAPEASARFAVSLPDGAEVVVRPPIGADQRSWRSRQYGSRDEAVAAMLESLVIEGHVAASDRAAVSAIASAMAEHDPLVAFTITYACPDCGTSREVAIDLERIALDRLVRLQRALVHDVHVLASAYGWTEAEVLAVSPRRRAQYRALIDETAS